MFGPTGRAALETEQPGSWPVIGYGLCRSAFGRYTRAMTTITKRVPGAHLAAIAVCMILSACTQMGIQPAAAQATPARTYEIVYRLKLSQGNDTATASITIGRGARRISELKFRVDPDRHTGFAGDGQVQATDREVVWNPPEQGGTLNYQVTITQKRRNGAYDARVTDDWALFRADDAFPPAATKARVGAMSDARLELELPDDWSALTTYLSADDKYTFTVDNPARRFDRPTGWVLVGKMGVRRGRIADTRVAIGSPTGENFHRMDLMAFLNWTLPGVRKVFPTLDPRLVIVSAGDPMWRGGLSGPGSLYVHADRPLISENGTSTFLHELVHVAMGVAGSNHDDWLVEGLAEYYSIKILRTSGTLSNRRMELALEDSREWGKDVRNLFVANASGEVTARATTLLAELDLWLTENSTGGRGLDDVVAEMIAAEQIYSYRALCLAAREVSGTSVPSLSPDRVPGAPDLPECASSD